MNLAQGTRTLAALLLKAETGTYAVQVCRYSLPMGDVMAIDTVEIVRSPLGRVACGNDFTAAALLLAETLNGMDGGHLALFRLKNSHLRDREVRVWTLLAGTLVPLSAERAEEFSLRVGATGSDVFAEAWEA